MTDKAEGQTDEQKARDIVNPFGMKPLQRGKLIGEISQALQAARLDERRRCLEVVRKLRDHVEGDGLAPRNVKGAYAVAMAILNINAPSDQSGESDGQV